MDKVIIIRYGEIFLKGKNRHYFEKLLLTNIINALKGIEFKYDKSQSRLYIKDFNESDCELIISKLSKVFGIYSFSVARRVPTDMDIIMKTACDSLPDEGSFRVTVHRADKSLTQTSIEIATDIGGYILDNKPKLTVDLHAPQRIVNIDIRENKTTYIFADSIKGQEGMPVGCSGKGLLLLSGGIDSPVAGFRMARRGMKINGIHFHSYPFTSPQAKQKVIDLAEIMSEYCGKFPLYCIPFTEIQQAIHQYCREDFMITVMRMIMVEIAEKVAQMHNCGALITGESLGQVASQTLESMTVTNSRVKEIPVFRPLVGMDKTEIIQTARQIGTFETSIQPFEDCCTVFLPQNPIIKPKLSVAEAEYDIIPNLQDMIDKCIEDIETIYIGEKDRL